MMNKLAPFAVFLVMAAGMLPAAEPVAVPTFNCIGLYWSPADGGKENGCHVRYRTEGAEQWRDALTAWFDERNKEYRGSIIDLKSGTQYEIELTLKNGDSKSVLKTGTWNENFPVAKTITLPEGISKKTFAVTESGKADGYVLYTFPAGSSSTIDVENEADYCMTVSSSFVIIRGITLKGARHDGIRLLNGAHDVVIEECDISGWGSPAEEGHGWGRDTEAAIRAHRVKDLQRIIIQRNKLHHPRYSTNSWDHGHPHGPQGITFGYCGGNHVIRYNEIYGDETHLFNDGMGGSSNYSDEGFPNCDSDIHGNIVMNVMDDAFEIEGGSRNVRVWGNYIDKTFTGVASAVCGLGPLYIFRNIENTCRRTPETGNSDQDHRGPFGKLGDGRGFGGGRRYFLHNTLLQAPPPAGLKVLLGASQGPLDAGGPMTNTISRNNIWHVCKKASSIGNNKGTGNDFDYDLFSSAIKSPEKHESHGIKGVPIYAEGHGPASGNGGRYQLDAKSPGFDQAERIPNFNDDFNGAAPDMGAHEAGSADMQFGVNAYRMKK
jgi:hypothetical protein